MERTIRAVVGGLIRRGAPADRMDLIQQAWVMALDLGAIRGLGTALRRSLQIEVARWWSPVALSEHAARDVAAHACAVDLDTVHLAGDANPEDVMLAVERRTRVMAEARRLLDTVAPAYRPMVEMLLGIDCEPVGRREIAALLGVTEKQVSDAAARFRAKARASAVLREMWN